jgi:hypothetical protein
MNFQILNVMLVFVYSFSYSSLWCQIESDYVPEEAREILLVTA